MSILQNSNAISDNSGPPTPTTPFTGGSLRFNQTNSSYLSRTFPTAGNRIQWTISMWVKRGALSNGTDKQILFSAGTPGVPSAYVQWTQIGFDVNGELCLYAYDQLQYPYVQVARLLTTQQVFQDPTAWYHIVVAINADDDSDPYSPEVNRIRGYVNGIETVSLGNPANRTVSRYITPQGEELMINSAQIHSIGRNEYTTSEYFDGTITQVHFVDGQTLTAADFGQFTSDGLWIPKTYTGTYGTTGFHLPFSTGTSTTTLGQDTSGNGNNWTLHNFTRSPGVNDCWMADYPLRGTSATQPLSNYSIANPLDLFTAAELVNANLQTISTSNPSILGSIQVSSGKWYWEIQFAGPDTTNQFVGLYSDTSYVAPVNTTNVIGVRYNGATGKLNYTINGTTWLNIATLTTGSFVFPFAISTASTKTIYVNFGQRAYAYTVPPGYLSICTANLPNPAITNPSLYFDNFVYDGNDASSRTFTGVGFQPGFVWSKAWSRSDYNHFLYDVVRGADLTKLISTSLTTGNSNSGLTNGGITSFNSDGFTVTAGSSNNALLNAAAVGFDTWLWRAGTSVTYDNNGTIVSQVCANQTSGFSVFKYPGGGSSEPYVGHGLLSKPRFVMIKNLSSTSDWAVYHAACGTNVLSLSNYDAAFEDIGYFNNLGPGKKLLPLGFSLETNTNGNEFIGYAFSQVDGFSKISSYVGTGEDEGPFVYCGFKPQFLLIKNITSYGSWLMFDAQLNPVNQVFQCLSPTIPYYINGANAINFTSNGFKIRLTNPNLNTSGDTYAFMAIAGSEFNNNNAA